MADSRSSYALLERILVLKRCALFSGVSTSELKSVAVITRTLLYRQGEHVFLENEIGDALFIVAAGSIKIMKSVEIDQKRQKEVLGIITAGGFFGEMSVIDEEIRSTTAIAEVDCTVLQIGKDDLYDVLQENPMIGIELLKYFVRNLRRDNDLLGEKR